MECCDGESLAQRLDRGALKLDDAVKVAIEIADALDKAHRAGIVHRDVKPGNIVLTRSGAKLLDFGLAKAVAPPVAAASPNDVRTVPGALTEEGTILGTFQYMAPEQIEGREADARTDVFALGAVMYEMLTGRTAFEGKSQASLLGAIMQRDPPPISAIQPLTPPPLDRVVIKCLAKDPDERWQSASDLASELKWIRGSSPAGLPPAIAARRMMRERVAWIVATACLLALIALLLLGRRGSPERRAAEAPTYRASIALPEGVRLPENPPGRFTLSPDGRRLAFVAADAAGRSALWVRPLDTTIAQPLAGTDGASFPFWSPDSRFIGFLAQGKLKKIDASGGTPFTLCDAFRGGGAWNRDDVILFTPKGGAPLSRVSASGGTPVPVTRLDAARGDAQHWFPFFLPDGRHFLYLATGSTTGGITDPRAIYVGSLDPTEPGRLLLQGGSNAKYARDHLIFLRGNTLMAQPFDVTSLNLHGEAVPLAEQVEMAAQSDFGTAGAFTVSDTGTLAYQAGSSVIRSQLIWFDRTGKQLSVLGDAADYAEVELSKDSRRARAKARAPGVAAGVEVRWYFEDFSSCRP